MALPNVLGLVFAADPRTKITGEIDIPIDAATVVSHSYRNSFSTETREDGSDVTDHILSEPESVTIEGLVSDFPVAIFGGVVAGAFSGTLGDVMGVQRPSRSAWDLLKQAHTTHAILRLETTLGTYEDMICETLETTQTRATANALRFTMTLRKDRRIRTEEASGDDLVDVVEGIADLASPTSNRGHQPGQVPTAAESAAFGG